MTLNVVPRHLERRLLVPSIKFRARLNVDLTKELWNQRAHREGGSHQVPHPLLISRKSQPKKLWSYEAPLSPMGRCKPPLHQLLRYETSLSCLNCEDPCLNGGAVKILCLFCKIVKISMPQLWSYEAPLAQLWRC